VPAAGNLNGLIWPRPDWRDRFDEKKTGRTN